MDTVNSESTAKVQQAFKLLCFLIPVLLLLGSYIYMTIHYHKLWLFGTVVHENGRYTLLQVILYFRHFLWELPIKAWYAMTLVGLFFFYGRPLPTEGRNNEISVPTSFIVACGVAVVAVGAIAWIGAIHAVGSREALIGFLQYRTSELRDPLFGSHWRNHFLSNIVLLSASTVLVLIYRMLTQRHWVRRWYSILFPTGIFLFIAISLILGINEDPFTQTSYLGHQVREIFGTDLPITMLLCTGLLIHFEQKYDLNANCREKQRGKPDKSFLARIILWACIAIVPTTYLIYKILHLDIAHIVKNVGQTKGWNTLDLFAWHFYEHSVDYIFVMAAVSFIYLTALKSDVGKNARGLIKK